MEHSPTVRGLRAGSYRGLTPIMHAALAGNTEVFSTVLTTLEATLTREQVGWSYFHVNDSVPVFRMNPMIDMRT